MQQPGQSDADLFGPGSVHDRLHSFPDWTPRRGTGPDTSFLEDVKRALEEVSAVCRPDPEADATWCQQCLPTLVPRLLGTPWRTLLECWTRSIHGLQGVAQTGWSAEDQARLRDSTYSQRVEQQKIWMDAVIVSLVEALVRHVDAPEPQWVLEPLSQLLDPGQPLYNRPRSKDTAICEDRGFFASMLQRQDRAPKMVRKWKAHASELNQLAWDTFFKLSGPEKVAGIISRAFEHDAGSDQVLDVTPVFGLIQKLPRGSQRSREHATKVCSELSRLISELSSREELPTSREVQLLSSVLDGLRQLERGEKLELVEHEEYDLLQTVDVRCQDGAIPSVELRPPAVVTLLQVSERSQHMSGLTGYETQCVRVAHISCGEVMGWIDVKQDRRLRAPTLRRRQASLVNVDTLVTKTRRWLCLSCVRQPKEDRVLRLEALKLLEEVCTQATDQRDLVNWLPRDALETVLEEALGEAVPSYHDSVDRACNLLGRSLPPTEEFFSLLMGLFHHSAHMRDFGMRQLVIAVFRREDFSPKQVAGLLRSMAEDFVVDNSENRAPKLQVVRATLEEPLPWKLAPGACLRLLLNACWAAGNTNDSSIAWLCQELVKEWAKRWGRDKEPSLEPFLEPMFNELVRLLAKGNELAGLPKSPSTSPASTDHGWGQAEPQPGDLVSVGPKVAVLRSLPISGSGMGWLVTMEDGTLAPLAQGPLTPSPSLLPYRPHPRHASVVGSTPRPTLPLLPSSSGAASMSNGSKEGSPHPIEDAASAEECRLRVPLLLSLLQSMLEGLQGSPPQLWGMTFTSKTRRSEFIYAADRREHLVEVVLNELALFARTDAQVVQVKGSSPGGACEPVHVALQQRLQFASYIFRHCERLELSLLQVVQLCEYFLVPPRVQPKVKGVFLSWLRTVFAWPSEDPASSTESTPVGRILTPRHALPTARLVLQMLQDYVAGCCAGEGPEQGLGCPLYFLYVQLVLEVNGNSGLGLLELVDDVGQRMGSRRLSVGLATASAGGERGHFSGMWIKVWPSAGALQQERPPKDAILTQHLGGSRYRVEFVDGAEDVMELEQRSCLRWQRLPAPEHQLPQQPSFGLVRASQLEGLTGLWSFACFSDDTLSRHAQALLLRVYDAVREAPLEAASAYPLQMLAPGSKSGAAANAALLPDAWSREQEAWVRLGNSKEAEELVADLHLLHIKGPGHTALGGPSVCPAGFRAGSQADYGAREWPSSLEVESSSGIDSPKDAFVRPIFLLLSRCAAAEGVAEVKPVLLPALRLLRSYIEGCHAKSTTERSLQGTCRGWDSVSISVRVEAMPPSKELISNKRKTKEPPVQASEGLQLPPRAVSDCATLYELRGAILDWARPRGQRKEALSSLELELLEFTGELELIIRRTKQALRSDMLTLRELGFSGEAELIAFVPLQAPTRTQSSTSYKRQFFASPSASAISVPSAIGPPEALSRHPAFLSIIWRCLDPCRWGTGEATAERVATAGGAAAASRSLQDTDLLSAAWSLLQLLPPQAALARALESPLSPEAAGVWSSLRASSDCPGHLLRSLYAAQLVDARLLPPGLGPSAMAAEHDASLAVAASPEGQDRALGWRRDFLRSPGWPWLVRLITDALPPDPVPVVLLRTGLSSALRALYFLVAGATLAQREEEADEDEPDDDGSADSPGRPWRPWKLPSRALSFESGREALGPVKREIGRLVARLVGLLDAAVAALVAEPEADDGLSKCGRASVGCLHAATLAVGPEDVEVFRAVSEVLIRTARCPGGAALAPVRKGALEALRGICSSDGPQASWVLEAVAQWLREATEASDEACDLVAEVSLAAVNRSGEASPASMAMKHSLEKLLVCLSRKLLGREGVANHESVMLAASILNRMLGPRPGSEAQAEELRRLLNSLELAPLGRGRSLAEQALMQYVLPTHALFKSSACKLVGEVVLQLLRGPMLVHAVRHVALWLAQISPPVKEHGASGEINWEVDGAPQRRHREGSNEPLGLVNEGSTCYMNSVVQQLFWIPPVRSVLAKCDRSLGESGVIEQLRATFLGLERGEGPSYNPRGLVDACSVLRLEYGVRSQNDAAEFYDQLVDYVQEQLLKDHTGDGQVAGGSADANAASAASNALPSSATAAVAAAAGVIIAGIGGIEEEEEELSAPAETLSEGRGASAKPRGPAAGAAVPPKLSLSGLLRGSRVRHKRCLVCNTTTKVSDEPFFRLEVPTRDLQDGGTYVEYHSLQEALQAMSAPEVMRGENRVECDGCGKRRTETEFSTGISVFPPYLFVQLKRFDFNLRTMRQEKLNHEVSFPFELDMWPYSVEADSLAAAGGNDVRDATSPTPSDVSSPKQQPTMQRLISEPLRNEVVHNPAQRAADDDRFMYELAGVVVHSGMAGGGHYYSLINAQEGEGEGASRRWMEFNDTWVAQLEEKEIEEKYFGGPRASRCAYLLLYRRRNAVQASTLARLQQVEAPLLPPSFNVGQPDPHGAAGRNVVTGRGVSSGPLRVHGVAPPFAAGGLGDSGLPLRPGEKVSVYSHTQERWVHDGEVCGVLGLGVDEQGPKGVPPGSVRVRYDCGTREKWVVPEQVSRQLMRMVSDVASLSEELQEPGESATGDAAKRMLWVRQQAAFSEAFVGFAQQLVLKALQEAQSLPEELEPDEEPVLLAARVLFEIVPHFQWEGRYAEWQQLLLKAVWSGHGGARMVCQLLTAYCAERGAEHELRAAAADSIDAGPTSTMVIGGGTGGGTATIDALVARVAGAVARSSWLGKMLFDCPHKEAMGVATTLVRGALEWLSPEPEAATEAVRSMEQFVAKGLKAQATGRSGMPKLAEFLRGITDSREACRALIGIHGCEMIGSLVELYLEARQLWRKAYPGYQEMHTMTFAKQSLNSLAEAVPLHLDADDLLSPRSKGQLANETLQADCWGQEDCAALVALALHVGGESKVLREIERCLSFTSTPGGETPPAGRPHEFRSNVQTLRVLLEHPHRPGAALTERWRALARGLRSVREAHLEPGLDGAAPSGKLPLPPGDEGLPAEPGGSPVGAVMAATGSSTAANKDEIGYCVVLLVRELAVLVADLVADPYRQGDLQVVAAVVRQTLPVYRSVGEWLSLRAQMPAAAQDSLQPQQASQARDALAVMLRQLGNMELVVHEATL